MTEIKEIKSNAREIYSKLKSLAESDIVISYGKKEVIECDNPRAGKKSTYNCPYGYISTGVIYSDTKDDGTDSDKITHIFLSPPNIL
ncbi:MAG: hypothetical protein ACMUJM_20135 [bacterium]